MVLGYLKVWKYNPIIFMVNNCVYGLSLNLMFTSDKDERTEESIEELTKEIYTRI